MLVIKLSAGIVMKIVLNMDGLRTNNATGVAVAKKLSLKVIHTMPVNIIPAHG